MSTARRRCHQSGRAEPIRRLPANPIQNGIDDIAGGRRKHVGRRKFGDACDVLQHKALLLHCRNESQCSYPFLPTRLPVMSINLSIGLAAAVERAPERSFEHEQQVLGIDCLPRLHRQFGDHAVTDSGYGGFHLHGFKRHHQIPSFHRLPISDCN